MSFRGGSIPCLALTPQGNPLILVFQFHHRSNEDGDTYSTQLYSNAAGDNPWHATVAQVGNTNAAI